MTFKLLRQEHSAVAQGQWRPLCQLLRQGPGARQQILSGQDLIDQAKFLRLAGGEGLAMACLPSPTGYRQVPRSISEPWPGVKRAGRRACVPVT
ncbi:MAG TPA: hypothetical protein VNP04_03785 [Alphaproteobacteria bacterium]|nr:hypothetical protein [Alphaproteobacteria bacterium]